MADEIDSHDPRQRRCPKLGHQVPFSYCRQPAANLPCGRILDCWWETFDVQAFLRAHYSDEDIREILTPRKDKRVSLVELIEKARNAQKPD